MTFVLGIDPGPTASAYALIDGDRRPIRVGKVENFRLLTAAAPTSRTIIAIEMIASYGMAVGKEVFETCVWIGRFDQMARHTRGVIAPPPELVYRRDVKLHHCHSAKAKDANITQALIDRFASGQPNRGKGTKAAPGWFHGFHSDIWAAYALAVYVADRKATS